MESSTAKPVILYVDDEEDNLVVFKSTFRRHYTILTATSAREGQEILAAHPEVQVVITDQRMPEVSGVEFLKVVLSFNPDPIRMVLSGFSDMEAVINAINEGKIYRYIPKPWDEQEIRMTIDGAVELFNLQRKNRELTNYLAEYNKQLEVKVAERTQELRSLNEQKSELLGIVAHDLKNPLMGILGITDMLRHAQEYGLQEEDQSALVSQIWSAGNRMSELIRQLLDANAIETGNLVVNVGRIDLAFTAETIVADYQTRAQAKQQTLEFDTAVSPAFVMADESLLHQVLDNLISNAIKYSPLGKHIRVVVTESTIADKTNSQVPAFRLGVYDEGPGLTDEDKTRLFGAFQRLSAQPTGGEHSTGLGLSIAKKMVEAMNGCIWCDSEAGKGAVFFVEFPAA
jgi:signal transduction histidine kinase